MRAGSDTHARHGVRFRTRTIPGPVLASNPRGTEDPLVIRLQTTREPIPGDHRVADAACQVWVVAELAENPNRSKCFHRAAEYALHLRGRQEFPVELTLVRCQTAKQHLE